jgi:archaellum component FlaC
MIVDFVTRITRRILVGKEQRFIFTKKDNITIPSLSKIDLYIHIPFCKNMCPYCPYNRIKYDENNLEMLRTAGIKTLVTFCADGYYAFNVLYDKMGKKGDLEVFHITQYLDRLIKEGRLKPTKGVTLMVTYHDPCHLGRKVEPWLRQQGKFKASEIYQPPRDILNSIPGLKFIEMRRAKENAWPAIVDKDVFRQVQRKMSSKRPEATHPRTIPSFYLLSGLLFCSCGHAMIGRSAKSHQYYYYVCNGSFKQGRDACDARALPKDKLEQLLIEQIKERVLNQEWLEELVGLVNKELDSSHDILRDRLDAIDAELNDVRIRLSKLYDALETGKLSLDDLAPRIKELRTRQDELSKARLQSEAEKITRGVKHVDAEVIKSYVRDLKSLTRPTASSSIGLPLNISTLPLRLSSASATGS